MAVSGPEIAARGLFYVGSPYHYGGAMGTVPNVDQGGDCSGLFNGVTMRDLGLAGPGVAPGTFTGAQHGPPVIAWATFKGMVTLPQGTPPSAGDACIWPGLGPLGHIGIAVSSTEMVSALDTQAGVVKTPIAGNGPAGVSVVYRRFAGEVLAGGTAAQAAAGSAAGGNAGAGILLLGAAVVPLVFAGVVLVAGLIVGLLGAALIGAVVSQGADSG
jgi:hypothetical protein